MWHALTHCCILLGEEERSFFRRKRTNHFWMLCKLYSICSRWTVTCGVKPPNSAKGLICSSFSAAEISVCHTVRELSLGWEMQRAWTNKRKGQNEITQWRWSSSFIFFPRCSVKAHFKTSEDHLKTFTDKSQKAESNKRDCKVLLAEQRLLSLTKLTSHHHPVLTKV